MGPGGVKDEEKSKRGRPVRCLTLQKRRTTGTIAVLKKPAGIPEGGVLSVPAKFEFGRLVPRSKRAASYLHLWQLFLMLLASAAAVSLSLAGYLRSGGGRELFRQVLERLARGPVNFDRMELGLGTLVVYNLRLQPEAGGGSAGALRTEDVALSGVRAEKATVLWNPLHWPPDIRAVRTVEIEGMKNLSIFVRRREFLQRTVEQPSPLPFPVRFKDVNLTLKVGRTAPLRLSGCSGEFRATETGGLGGTFHLRLLNDRPFDFKLEALEDGRWSFTGRDMDVDTRRVLSADKPYSQGEESFDPVALLLGALFSGECGAKGHVDELRVEVRPATAKRSFLCMGEISYRGLRLDLPSRKARAGRALPSLLGRLFGAREGTSTGFWPRGFPMDSVIAGPRGRGRLRFRMENGRLVFNCYGGAAGAFVMHAGKDEYAPLEALRGTLETDEQRRLKRVEVRGFVGDAYRFDLFVRRNAKGRRVFELSVQPRDETAAGFLDSPLWRFRSRVEVAGEAAQPSKPAAAAPRSGKDGKPPGKKAAVPAPLFRFQINAEAQRFPFPEQLPPGLLDLGGRLVIKGEYREGRRLLVLSSVRVSDGFIVCGSPPDRTAAAPSPGVPWDVLRAAFAAEAKPWRLREISLTGRAELRFDKKGHPREADLEKWKLKTGRLERLGKLTDWSGADIEIAGALRVAADEPEKRHLSLVFGPPKKDWTVKLEGEWREKGGRLLSAELTRKEEGVPLKLHPDRDKLSRWFRGTAKPRTVILRYENGHFIHLTPK